MPRGGPVYRGEVDIHRPALRKPLAASSRVYSGSPGARSIRKTGRKTSSDQWQSQLWDFYNSISEYWFACSWVGNQLSKARLIIHKDGKPSDDPVAQGAIDSLFGGSEGQAEMLRLLGVNFTVAGEAYVIGEPGIGQEPDRWRVAAATEVNGADSGGGRITVESEPIAPQSIVIRLWKAHAQKSTEADSPSRALLPVLTQLFEISQVISAQASSRLTSAGILWVPSEMELPTISTVLNDGDEESDSVQQASGADGLTEMLMRIASIAIKDRDSAAANIPLVVTTPGEFIEKIQKTDFWSGFDEHAKELRDEAVARIANGMDMPPEVLTGTADVNHWGGAQIEEAAIKSHTEPLLDVVTSSLTTGFLHPYLKSKGVANFRSFTIEADTSALRLRPNRSKEALELWDRGAIAVRTLLIENGFDPDVDTPDDAEKVGWFLRKVASGSTTPDQVAAALKQLGISAIPGAASPTDTSQEAPSDRSLLEHPVRRIEPDRKRSEDRRRRIDDGEIAASASSAFVADGLVLASEVMVYRALERAGNRLKRKGIHGSSAADLYLSLSSVSSSEIDELMRDAWGCLDRFEYPGVSTDSLRLALDDYTRNLVRTHRPHTRQALARHLLLALAGGPDDA